MVVYKQSKQVHNLNHCDCKKTKQSLIIVLKKQKIDFDGW